MEDSRCWGLREYSWDLLGLVHGHVSISCPCLWSNAVEAVLPQKLVGPWQVGMLSRWCHCTRQVWDVMRWGFCWDSALPWRSTALLHQFGAFTSPKIKAEKCKGLWKWRADAEENIPVGFRGNCHWSSKHHCQPDTSEPFFCDFGQNWSWFFGHVQVLLLPIHTWMGLALQKGIRQPMGQSPQAWENSCEITRISNTCPKGTHISHPSYTCTNKQDEWKQ